MQINIAGAPQIRHAIQSARSEVLLALPANCSFDGQVDVAAAQRLTADSGVSVRVYVPSTARGTSALPEHRLAALAKEGMQIHSTPDTTPRMAIVDRSVVVLARNQEDYSHGALIGRELIVTQMLVRSLTAPAPAAEDPAPAPDADFHPLSREVLRQLALGTTDETAARQIGMALRTYRRVVSRLMDSLDARSRFQAGYLAAQRDLLL
ncbi:hypothetical protein OG264_16965 [Streptomyces xanthophaeus]|uniref:hypothetical protein n=1 Tax=Streptomyces xanthophaeus TaxID=67385 RepID=UPI00386E8FF9|nr:hypothetical protein OG264_16965 [Streptomyces xanthophaeus]WST61990.1 hypothetical protein OG605_21470 [Streptomyces xanthophaeus]